MGIGISNPNVEEVMPLDHAHDLLMRGNGDTTLRSQKREYFPPVSQTSKSKFTDDGRMAQQDVILDDQLKLRIEASEMIDPD